MHCQRIGDIFSAKKDCFYGKNKVFAYNKVMGYPGGLENRMQAETGLVRKTVFHGIIRAMQNNVDF